MKTAVELKADILKAIAHPNRIRIVEALRCDETCNCELGPELQLEQSNLSRHLAVLVRSGVIEAKKEGVKTFYHVVDQSVFQILDIVREIVVRQVEHQVRAVKQ